MPWPGLELSVELEGHLHRKVVTDGQSLEGEQHGASGIVASSLVPAPHPWLHPQEELGPRGGQDSTLRDSSLGLNGGHRGEAGASFQPTSPEAWGIPESGPGRTPPGSRARQPTGA